MASNGVNVKMGVSGIAQFKQSMKQAQTSVKTLDAELALNEKQYKASGDAEAYMEQKTELLRKKLEEQKTAVSAAEKALEEMNKNGVDQASTAYQNMQQALANAKGNLLDTETQLGNISTAALDATGDVDGMTDALNSINTNVSLESVHSALGTITESMGAVIKKAWEVGKAITKDVLGAGSWADDVATKAKVYGMSTDELQRWQKTAEIVDTSVESIVGAQRKLNKNLGTGGTSVAEALKGLGLSNVVSTDPDEMFWKVGEAIMNMGDAYTQEEYAQKLFGKSWHELIPLFSEGREAVEELNASWNVVPQEQIDALTEMDDKYKMLEFEIDTVKRKFEAELAPAVTTVMGTLTDLVGKFNDYLQTENGKEMMESLSTAVTNMFSKLTEIDPDSVMETVIGAIDTLKKGLDWFAENGETVVKFIEGFVGAWAALKVTTGITTVLKLVEGIRGLTASSAATAGATAGASWAGSFASAAMQAAPFLAFLYTLLNPSSGAGDQLDSLWDANGNPTEAAKAAGITQTYDEYNNGGGARSESVRFAEEDIKRNQEAAAKAKLNTQYTGDAEAAEARNRRQIEALHSLERLQEAANSGGDSAARNGQKGQNYGILSEMPDKVAVAVTEALSGVKIEMDGKEVGSIVSPYVDTGWGGLVLKMTK